MHVIMVLDVYVCYRECKPPRFCVSFKLFLPLFVCSSVCAHLRAHLHMCGRLRHIRLRRSEFMISMCHVPSCPNTKVLCSGTLGAHRGSS